ncbi:MAG: transcriptional repressor [Verrucomicrobiales bacterium]|nr:transcriptional repressor [Verrucomicrobiales bacterium]
MSQTSPDLESLLEDCAQNGLRRTSALRACLKVLLSSDQPLTLQEIGAKLNQEVECDPATVYRLVTRLEEKRIVRRIGFHSRAAHYCLRISAHQDYLVCRDCGSVEVLDIACPVEHLEKQIATESGFRDLDHELEFYGQCAACQV